LTLSYLEGKEWAKKNLLLPTTHERPYEYRKFLYRVVFILREEGDGESYAGWLKFSLFFLPVYNWFKGFYDQMK
jgi:hypothetical protein